MKNGFLTISALATVMLCAMLLAQPVSDVQAQEAAANTANAQTGTEAGTDAPQAPKMTPSGLTEEELNAPFKGTLMFSKVEMAAINTALSGYVSPTVGGSPEEAVKPRLIKLAGVVYRDANDWTVWLNGYKLGPGRLLPEIAEIYVHENRVHLKWFDAPTNEIISITLRPHQTYDILTGILLPG